MVELGPPFPLACDTRGAPHAWYEYKEAHRRVVESEIDSIIEGAPTQLVALDWRSVVEQKISRAIAGRIPRLDADIERTFLGDGVYELKDPLSSSGGRTTLLRLYLVDLESREGTATIGCFKAAEKFVCETDAERTKSFQDADIEEASHRCDRTCATGRFWRMGRGPSSRPPVRPW